jgi:hypothetical protein
LVGNANTIFGCWNCLLANDDHLLIALSLLVNSEV